MEINSFNKLKERFEKENTEGKIDIYLTAEGLTQEQYMSLLRSFPKNEIGKLERAMQEVG